MTCNNTQGLTDKRYEIMLLVFQKKRIFVFKGNWGNTKKSLWPHKVIGFLSLLWWCTVPFKFTKGRRISSFIMEPIPSRPFLPALSFLPFPSFPSRPVLPALYFTPFLWLLHSDPKLWARKLPWEHLYIKLPMHLWFIRPCVFWCVQIQYLGKWEGGLFWGPNGTGRIDHRCINSYNDM